MTAPLSQRLRCLIVGHDWRRAIGPRHGYYLRCRRCWISGEEEAPVEAAAPSAAAHRVELPQ